MQEQKSSNNGLLILIAILFIVIILLVGLLLIKDNKKEEPSTNSNDVTNTTNNEVEEVIEKDLSVEETLVKNLSNRIIGIYMDNFIAEEYGYNLYFYKKDKTILANEDMAFRLSIAAEHNNNLTKTSVENGISYVYIEEESLKQAYYDLFGKDANYSRNTFYLSSIANGKFTWSEEKKRYETKATEGGGMQFDGYSKIGAAKQIISSKEDRIEIYEYVVFNGGLKVDGLCSDYNKTNIITTDTSIGDAVFDQYPDKVGQYKYTFIKDKYDTYVFTSVEKIK